MEIILMLDPLAAALLILAVGLSLCFFGRRLVIFALAVACFMLGYLYGGEILASVTQDSFLIDWGPWIAGVLAAVAGVLLYRLSVFAAGALIAWFVLEQHAPGVHIVVRVLGSLAAGGLLLAFRKPLLSILTAFMGASMTALASVSLLAHLSVSVGVTIYWIILLVLTAAGFYIQMKSAWEKK